MIISKFLLLSGFLILSLTACQKDNEPTPATANPPACRLIKQANDDNTYTNFEYNAQGYLIKISGKEIGSNGADGYTLFIYDANNRLVKTEYYTDGQQDSLATYEYTGDVITAAKYYNPSGAVIATGTYQYDTNKRIIEVEDHGYVFTLTYDTKGNVMKQESSLDNIATRITYEDYDDKFTPEAHLISPLDFFFIQNKNNPGKVTYAYDINNDGIFQAGESVASTFTYKYNEHGFPTEITETYNSNTYVSTYTYACN